MLRQKNKRSYKINKGENRLEEKIFFKRIQYAKYFD